MADVCMCVNGRCVVLCACALMEGVLCCVNGRCGVCMWEHLPSAFAGLLMVGLLGCRSVRVLDFHGLFLIPGDPDRLGERASGW